MSVKVLVVDDSGFFRKRIGEILSAVPEIEVVGAASNGKEGLDKAKKLKPDVITMDYEMPVMDGVTAVRHIMAECPTPILMFSSLTYQGARVTLDALEAGAVDFLPKNFEDISRNTAHIQALLKERILQVAGPQHRLRSSALSKPAQPDIKPGSQLSSASTQHTSESRVANSSGNRMQPVRSSTRHSAGATSASSTASSATAAKASAKPAGPKRRGKKTVNHAVDLLLIGTSTGGPVALQKIMSQLPANLPVPVLLVQHMPATFTPAFAERLNSTCPLKVRQAQDGDVVRPGEALLAPGGKQMLVKTAGRSASVNVIDGDERLTYKPSVDLTFGSASRSFGGKVLALVLTGMGADGREGCRLLKASGATVWTQSEKSCVIYGMPMAVDKAGYSDLSLDLNDIASSIVSELM